MAVPFEERLRVVKRVLEQGESKSHVALTEGYARASVHTWVTQYLAHGEAGLIKKKGLPRYSQKIKDQYLASVEAEGLTVTQASKKFGIPKQTFYDWRNERDQALLPSERRETRKRKEKLVREELQALRKENKRLRMENEVLKKLQASAPKKINEMRKH